MRIISLGWGVQSFGLAAMSALGVLPRVDVAIHADTTHERSQTYELARRWTPWLEERGVRVVTVRNEDTKSTSVVRDPDFIMIPAFSTYPDGRPSGMIHRQCTHDWKIAPIRRWLQANRNRQPVEMWLGITFDEIQRMKVSRVQYITNRFPFIDGFDRPWRRSDVVRWLQENDIEIPPKSACVFCPFHTRTEWREIKLHGDGDWQRAVEIDEAIRHTRSKYVAYLTHECRPLADVDFSNEQDRGQLTLWDSEECEGMCFL